MNLKTEAWPEGRDWPDQLTLDVGSSMPTDVYGCDGTGAGVVYVRDDVVDRRLSNALAAIHAAHGLLSPLGNHVTTSAPSIREAIRILRNAL